MKANEEALTAERVRELLDYSPETGGLLWKVSQGAAKAGSVAGTTNNKGYRLIKIDGRSYFSHRLVWVHANGVWPANQIDHINGVRNDNRITNLREATVSENVSNQRKARTDSQTGLLGASWHRGMKKFEAQIQLDGKITRLGYFPTAEQAHQAYLVAKRELHPFCTI